MVPAPHNSRSEQISPIGAELINRELRRIHSEIHRHLRGEMTLRLSQVKKLAKSLKKIEHEVDLKEKTVVSTAKNILLRIRKELSPKSKSRESQSTHNSTEKSISWRTRNTNQFLELGKNKRKYNSSIGSLRNSEDSSSPDTLRMVLLTGNTFCTQQQTPESDISTNVGTGSSSASDGIEQVLTTNANTQPSSVQVGSISQSDDSSLTSAEDPLVQMSIFQDSQADQTNIESDTIPKSFDTDNISNESPMSIKITDENEQVSTASNNTQPNSANDIISQYDDSSSYSPEDNSDFQTSNIQQSPEGQSTTSPQSDVENSSNESPPAQMLLETIIIDDEGKQVLTTYTHTQTNSVQTTQTNSVQTTQTNSVQTTQTNSEQTGSNTQFGSSSSTTAEDSSEDTQISNSKESQAVQPNIEFQTNPQYREAFEAENSLNESMEISQIFNFPPSMNTVSDVSLQRTSAVSPAPSNTSFFDSFKSYVNNNKSEAFDISFRSDVKESQQIEPNILDATFEWEDDLCVNPVGESDNTQIPNYSQSIDNQLKKIDTMAIGEEQKFTSSESSENQTTNTWITLPSQINGRDKNIVTSQPVEDNSYKSISFNANSENGINQHQSDEIFPESQQTNHSDVIVHSQENDRTQSFQFNPEDRQFNNNGTNVPLLENNVPQEIMDQSDAFWEVVEMDDMDLTYAESGFEGVNQQLEKTNSFDPETQASLVFGMPIPVGTNDIIFPTQPQIVTQTNDKFESKSNSEDIVPETMYTESQRVHSKSPRIRSPYTQSSSFSKFKATAKSQASLAVSKKNRVTSSSTRSKDNANLIEDASSLRDVHFSANSSSSSQEHSQSTIVKIFPQSQELQSQNLVLINGCIPENSQSQNNDDANWEELYSAKEEKLAEKVMERREKYTNEKWKELPMTEKVSGRFADKFHVRIFDDPVEALTNIRYKPCFSTSTFPRLTLNEMHEGMKKAVNHSREMDTILKNIVDKLKDQNSLDPGLGFSQRRGTDESLDDSDSSDEERKANRRWLREYRAKTKIHRRGVIDEPDEGKPDFTSRRARMEEQTEEEKDEAAMVDLMAKFGKCDWLKN